MGKDRKANFTNRLDGEVPKTDVNENNDVTTDYNVDVENVSSGASLTFPIQASALRKNGYAMLKGNPCKIVDMCTSKPGKHGHSKVLLVGLDLFTGKRYEELSPSSHTMSVPVVTRNDYLVIDMGHDGYLSLLTDDGYTKCDIRVQNADMRKSLQEKLDKREDNDVMVTPLFQLEGSMQNYSYHYRCDGQRNDDDDKGYQVDDWTNRIT